MSQMKPINAPLFHRNVPLNINNQRQSPMNVNVTGVGGNPPINQNEYQSGYINPNPNG